RYIGVTDDLANGRKAWCLRDGPRDDAVANRRGCETVGDARRELALRIACRRFLRRLLRQRRDPPEHGQSEGNETAWQAASCAATCERTRGRVGPASIRPAPASLAGLTCPVMRWRVSAAIAAETDRSPRRSAHLRARPPGPRLRTPGDRRAARPGRW